MKLLHLADLHLGSEMNARLTAENAKLRRGELRAAFYRAVEYAKASGVAAVLLCGDVFDTALPMQQDKEFFYDVIRSTPSLTFFYIKGNHDEIEDTEQLPNLKTFTADGWMSYDLGEGVCVSGIELNGQNSESYYDTLRLDVGKKNVVLLHGQIAETKGEEKICLRALAGKHIDYLALGHIHTYSSGSIDARGTYAYAGCLEPRGFDEVGVKGFVLVDIGQGVSHTFIENAARSVELVEVDVGGLGGPAQVLQKVERELTVDEADMPRVVLVGEVDFDTEGLANFVYTHLKGKYFALSVKDETQKALHLEEYEGQVSIEAEFVRVVLANDTLTQGQKKQVIAMGLKALKGEKL